MPPNDGIYIPKLVSQSHRAPAAFEIGPDADDLRNPRGFSTRQHLWQFIREVRIIQMGVRVVKNRHNRLKNLGQRPATDKADTLNSTSLTTSTVAWEEAARSDAVSVSLGR